MDSGIITLGVVVVVSIGLFLGSYTTMYGFQQAGYSVTPMDTDGTAEEIMEDMEDTATDLKSSLTGEQSWLQTAFNIFFTAPNSVMSTLSTISNSAGKMITLGTGEDNPITLPSWSLNMIFIIVAMIIVSALIYLALGRRG